MYIYDKRFEDVDVHDVVSERTRSSVSSAVKKIFSKVEQSLQSESDTAVDKGEVRSVASKLVDDLIVSSTDIVNLADLKTYDDYTYQRSVQVCISEHSGGNGNGVRRKSAQDACNGRALARYRGGYDST